MKLESCELQVIREGEGELVVARRPTIWTGAWNYAPCTSCYIFCHQDSIPHHRRNCPLKKSGDKSKPVDSYNDGMLLIETYIPSVEGIHAKYLEIIEGMRETTKNPGTSLLQCLHFSLRSQKNNLHFALRSQKNNYLFQ